jgi:hypothetical protein
LRRRRSNITDKIVNFNCPPELLGQFDKAIEGEYGSRTDAFLDLMRHFVEAAVPSSMTLLEEIISEMENGKLQSSIPIIYVTSDFLKSAEDQDSRLRRELELCRYHKIKVVVHYANDLTSRGLASAAKLLENIPLFTQNGESKGA